MEFGGCNVNTQMYTLWTCGGLIFAEEELIEKQNRLNELDILLFLLTTFDNVFFCSVSGHLCTTAMCFISVFLVCKKRTILNKIKEKILG